MPHSQCNPRTLFHLEAAIACCKAKHSEEEIKAAAKALGLSDWLYVPYTPSLLGGVA